VSTLTNGPTKEYVSINTKARAGSILKNREEINSIGFCLLKRLLPTTNPLMTKKSLTANAPE
jgi:hypothetical protein